MTIARMACARVRYRLCNDMRFRTHREGHTQALAQAARHVAGVYALYALRLAVIASTRTSCRRARDAAKRITSWSHRALGSYENLP